MNYLSQNNHKYLSNPQKLINFNGVKPSTADDTNPELLLSCTKDVCAFISL